MKGTICDVVNLGTIVQVITKDEEVVINFDRRMFHRFLEGACGEDAMMEDLLGLEIDYDGETVTEFIPA